MTSTNPCDARAHTVYLSCSEVSEMITSKLYRDEETAKLGRMLSERDNPGVDKGRDVYRDLKTADHLYREASQEGYAPGKHGHALMKRKKRFLPDRLLHKVKGNTEGAP